MDDVDFKEVFDNRSYILETKLNKNLTLKLVAGYNSRFRYAVIKRCINAHYWMSPILGTSSFTFNR